MIQKILDVKDYRLRIPSKPIQAIDKKILKIAQDLKETLLVQKDPEGVGLAASQIGKNIRMFAMLDDGKIRIVVNPKIISIREGQKPKEKDSIMEGCLSILNYYGSIKRPQLLTLQYEDLEGNNKVEKFEGLSAQIVQHEIDHLNGILFTDKLLEQKSSLYKLNKSEWEEIDL